MPPSGNAWDWDAGAGTLDPSSSSLITAWLSYALPGNQAYFTPDVAQSLPSPGTGYAISGTAPDEFDSLVYITPGDLEGCSDDHHLWVYDAPRGRESDLYQASPAWSADGGCSFPIGTAQEPPPGNSNAGRLPLGRGLITYADVMSGSILHPLVFSMPNVGGPTVYPANGDSGGGTGLALGQWLRLDPSVVVSGLGLPAFETMICYALQTYGMFLRDIGSVVDIGGLDMRNQGGNGLYAGVGVSLSILSQSPTANYPYAAPLSTSMPWSSMQVLLPPVTGSGGAGGGGTGGGGGGSTMGTPANLTIPVITGTYTSGQTLSASLGTWSNMPTLTFAYDWQRDTGSGFNSTGTTSSLYAVTGADVGATIRVVVTATNSYGSTPDPSLSVAYSGSGGGGANLAAVVFNNEFRVTA